MTRNADDLREPDGAHTTSRHLALLTLQAQGAERGCVEFPAEDVGDLLTVGATSTLCLNTNTGSA